MSQTPATCGSCGRTDPNLTEVHRVYVTIADDGSEAARVLDEVERWCGGCLATYPHTPA